MSGETLAMKAELDASGVASGFQQINSHLSQFGIQTGTASTSLGGLGTMLGTLANPMTAVAAGALAVGSALTTSVGVAGNFQQSMANVTAIMGGSEAEMQAMSAAAREAGATTQYSATQAAEALSYMAGAGWNSTQATAGLKDTLTMAAAGGMDLAAAGDLMTGTIAQFNLQATDAGRVSNVLAAGASATNTSVSQLGAGMTVVGATANAFGMSLESTTAALGALSNGNIKGAEGGTALRGILASLATQSGPAAAALSELGLSAADVNPETNQLSDTMQLLEERGMTATQAIAIFGRENVSAATYLAAHSSELDGLQTSITGTTKASEMAAIQTATYQGAMGELSSACEEAQISLGEALLPVLTEGVKVLTDIVNIGTAAGKAVAGLAGDVAEAAAPVADAFMKYTPTGWLISGTSDLATSAWGDLKEWAGIGDEAAESVAEGVKENKDLATAPADAMKTDAAKKATEEAVDVFGDNYLKALKDSKMSEEIAIYAASGFSDEEALAAINDQVSEANDVYDRSFEYLGKQFRLQLSKGSSGWQGSLFSGDTLLNNAAIFQQSLDPIKMFEAITGLPAPEEATAEYLRLVGKASEAEKLEMKLKGLTFDYGNISDIFGEQFVTRLQNEGSRISQTASEEVQNEYQALLDALEEPTWENLDETLQKMDKLVAEHELDPSEAALWADRYKQVLLDEIVDVDTFLKSEMKGIGESATSAMEDGAVSRAEASELMGYGPILETLKAKFPEKFKAIGGESALAMIAGLKSGDYAAVGEYAGAQVKKGAITAFNTTKGEEFKLSDWIKEGANLSDISNYKQFYEDVFAPALIQESADALDLLGLSISKGLPPAQELIEEFKTLDELLPGIFTAEQRNALETYTGSVESATKTLQAMSKKIETGNSNLKEFKETIELCEPLSEDLFAQWQEGSESGVFFEGYVGASYGQNFENYLKRLSSQYSSVADSAERLQAAHNGQYIAPGMADLSLDIDTTRADENLTGIETDLDSIIGKVKEPLYLEIHFTGEKSVATAGAASTENTQSLANTWQNEISNLKVGVDIDRSDFDELLKDIATAHHTPVIVDVSANAAQIRAIVDDAIADALSNIRV